MDVYSRYNVGCSVFQCMKRIAVVDNEACDSAMKGIYFFPYLGDDSVDIYMSSYLWSRG